MKYILYILINIFFVATTCIYSQVNDEVVFSSDYHIKNIVLKDSNTYSRIELLDLHVTDHVGYPALPVEYIKFIIPANSDAKNIVITNTKHQKIELKNKIKPVQPPIPTQVLYKEPDFVKPNMTVYNSKSLYPSEVIEIVEQGYFRGNRIVTLAVYPFQYLPKKDKLIYYSSISFTLNYKEDKKKLIREKVINNKKSYNKILKSVVYNKEDIDQFNVHKDYNSSNIKNSTSTLKDGEKDGISIDCDYIVVTSESLTSAFTSFINWKKSKGIDIDLITIENIKSNYTGDNISGISDDAGKLRQFLADAYDNGNGIEYALLGGDHNIVPIRYGWHSNTNNDPNYVIPNDLYFSDFDGDWEVDNDNRYGEPEDNVDFYPEIYIGRVMISTAAEVKNWIHKLLTYEKNPGNGDFEYLTKAFYTQADEFQRNSQAETIANRFSSIFSQYTIWEEIYDGVPDYNSSETPDFPTGKGVITKMNTHYGLNSWFAHGSPKGAAVGTKRLNKYEYRTKHNIGTKDNYDEDYGYSFIIEANNSMEDLTNINHPSIIYTPSCEQMPFDDFNHSSEIRNMGEGFTVINKSGGAHFLGNTRYGWVSSSFNLYKEFINVITDHTSYHIGIAEAISKTNYFNRYLRYSHNLLGCPETEIWTSIPTVFTSVSIDDNVSSVIVNTGSVNNCRICVMSKNDNGESYWDVAKNTSSHTFNNVPEPYTVTITKHNYIPYIYHSDVAGISNMFVQNETFYNNDKHLIFAHKDIHIGSDVTASKPSGPVTLQNGSDITFDAGQNVNIGNDFTIEKGAKLIIETQNVYPNNKFQEEREISMYQYTPSYWKTINFPDDYDNPVVIAGPLTTNGWDPATIRISTVSSNSCDIQIDEWDYLDGYRLSEQEKMSMMVMEAGQYNIGGLKVEAGIIENVNHNFQSHSFSQNFEEAPVVLTQVITKNDPAAVVTRHRNTSTTSFELRLQEEQAADGIHGNEQVAYIAIEPGYGTFCGQHIEVGRTGTSVNHNWYTINFNNDFTGVPTGFLAQIQSAEGMDPCNLKRKEISSTSVKVMVEEEKSADTEINHTNEVVGYIILE